ncbi:MAG: hypothetical protein R6W90_09040 [Ignavibacteriaceae bacterium]
MIKLVLLSVFTLFIIAGCTTVTETIYLQDIKVDGPVNHPPLHITKGQKTGTVTVSPRLSINPSGSFSGRLDGHTRVDQTGAYRVEKIEKSDGTWEYQESGENRYDFSGKNMNWDAAGSSVGVDVDIAVSDHFALFGGLNYVVHNQKDLIGGCAGMGFFSEKDNHGVRFDLGITWQEMFYDASTVVVTTVSPHRSPSYSYVTFYRDRDESSSINFFTSFTYNTALEDFPLNFFINASYFSQSLFDFEPGNANTDYYPFAFTEKVIDARGEASAAFLSISPGIYQSIGSLGRVMLGVKMLKETQLENSSGSFFVLPVIQFDLNL